MTIDASILFVDDDPMVLNALERTFFEHSFQTFFAQSAQDAYKIFDQHTIDMVVSDVRMLPIHGPEFLQTVRTAHPSTIRIILSAYSDQELMIKIICEGLAQLYFVKPWDNTKLVTLVTNILSLHDSLKKTFKLGDSCSEISLPITSALNSKLTTLLENDSGTLKALASAIETDAAASATMLKIANSSFYGTPVSSVHHALVTIGIDNFKKVILTSGLLKSKSRNNEQDDCDTINRHMVTCCRLCSGLHQHLVGSSMPEEHLCACLLADIGRLLMFEYNPDGYRSVLKQYAGAPHTSLAELEMTTLGFTHAQCGAMLLDCWNLPSILIESSLHHHDLLTDALPLPHKVMGLLHIADNYAWKIVEKIELPPVPDDLLMHYQLSTGQVEEIITTILHKIDL